MKFLLIDNCIDDIEMILSYINRIEEITVEYYTNCAKVPLKDINHYDAVLLDIEMPKEDGIFYAKRIRELSYDIPIIFITWHSTYEHESFQVHPFMFIYKENFSKEIITCIHELKIRKERIEKVFIYKDVKIRLCNILYFKTEKNDCYIITNNQRPISMRISLEKIELMHLSGFVRINKSVIMNMQKIVKWCKHQEIEAANGDILKISRGKKAFVKNEYEKFLLEDHGYEHI